MPDEKSVSQKGLWGSVVGALGVVFGDIGTSPLYAIGACFTLDTAVTPTRENVLGILSLVFWALTFVISIKYLIFILRADNTGEGGIMALLALLRPRMAAGRSRNVMIFLGLLGTALLYGDGVITPSISVLSAVEGLKVATPAFEPYVVPITVVILVLLFSVQSRGTAMIGAVFGPLTFVWFVAIAAIGLPAIFRNPDILRAVDPYYAFEFLVRSRLTGFLVLSAVVLCITGGEALYADMGHFGPRPIRIGWFALVFPALIINYFGQGALLLEKGAAVAGNPFFGLVSGWAIYPMVLIATIATVIASQALISGAYSLTQQALQLGYIPRLTLLHTSRETEGQIYVPMVNTLLMVTCVGLVVTFQEASRLAAAYGIAVTGTMAITSVLYFGVTRQIWGWSMARAGTLTAAFLAVDLAFFASNLNKLVNGGWIPILIATLVLVLMTTWRRGRELLASTLFANSVPLETFVGEIAREKPYRVPATAIFMVLNQKVAPAVILHHYKHNRVLHERVVLLSIYTEHVPEIKLGEKVRVNEVGEGFFRVSAHYGYMERPDVSEVLEICTGSGGDFKLEAPSFFLGRETYVISHNPGMAHWRKRLFVFLSRNARTATEYFELPPDRVIEIGLQVVL